MNYNDFKLRLETRMSQNEEEKRAIKGCAENLINFVNVRFFMTGGYELTAQNNFKDKYDEITDGKNTQAIEFDYTIVININDNPIELSVSINIRVRNVGFGYDFKVDDLDVDLNSAASPYEAVALYIETAFRRKIDNY